MLLRAAHVLLGGPGKPRFPLDPLPQSGLANAPLSFSAEAALAVTLKTQSQQGPSQQQLALHADEATEGAGEAGSLHTAPPPGERQREGDGNKQKKSFPFI